MVNMNKIIDGRKVRDDLVENLKKRAQNLSNELRLDVILVGNNSASNVYVNNKRKLAQEIGIKFVLHHFPDDVESEVIENLIKELNCNSAVTGFMVQLPLPKHINEQKICNLIKKEKDVDGFTIENTGLLAINDNAIIPCTPKGIMYLLDYYGIKVSGKNVVIIGRSNIVGRPLISCMLNNDATVTVCHSKTENLKFYTKNADILIVAIGKPKYIDESYIKDGAIVIDVGINRVDGKIVGDCDFDSMYDKVSYITKVPGGVGPMTVAMLMLNIIEVGEYNESSK